MPRFGGPEDKKRAQESHLGPGYYVDQEKIDRSAERKPSVKINPNERISYITDS